MTRYVRAMSQRRKRGRPIKVPSWWLDQISEFKEQSGKTLKVLGEELSVLLRTERPIHPASVFEYMQGKSTTLEMTQAFASLMGTPMPEIADSNDEELHEWTELGRRLRAHTPDKFKREIELLRRLVEALEAHEKRR
jgi:hypothetical protein